MKQNRRKHNPAFKPGLPWKPLKGGQTVWRTRTRFEVHPSQIRAWKKALDDGAPGVFSGEANSKKDNEGLVAQLYQQIRHLKVEPGCSENAILANQCRVIVIPCGAGCKPA